MAEYEKPIGRFSSFPVSEVLLIEVNFLARLIGQYATVTLNNGLKYQFSKAEYIELRRLKERLDGLKYIHSIIVEQKALNRGSK